MNMNPNQTLRNPSQPYNLVVSLNFSLCFLSIASGNEDYIFTVIVGLFSVLLWPDKSERFHLSF